MSAILFRTYPFWAGVSRKKGVLSGVDGTGPPTGDQPSLYSGRPGGGVQKAANRRLQDRWLDKDRHACGSRVKQEQSRIGATQRHSTSERRNPCEYARSAGGRTRSLLGGQNNGMQWSQQVTGRSLPTAQAKC